MLKLLAQVRDPAVRRSLRISLLDAALWAVMFGLAENVIVPYALVLGATGFMVALLQGSAQLMIATGQLTGVVIARSIRRRKPWVVTFILLHALSWVVVVIGTRIVAEPWVVIVAFAGGIFLTNMGGPSWISWMNELVPPAIRGRYWGGRNRLAGAVQVVAILTGGWLLARWPDPPQVMRVFAALFLAGAVARALGAIPVATQVEPERGAAANGEARGNGSSGGGDAADPALDSPPMQPKGGLFRFLVELVTTPFGRFMLFYACMIFAAGFMAPAIPLYLLQSRGLDYFTYSAVNMTSMALSFFAMSYWGPLSDRFGNYRIMVVTGGVLPLVAIGWVVARTVPLMFVVQAVAGFAWAGFNLSATNYIFDSQPTERAGRAMAYFAALTNVFAFLGSLVAGVMIDTVADWSIPLLEDGNFEVVFLASGVVRFLVFLFLVKTFSEVRPVEGVPPRRYFYFQQPLAILSARFEFFRTFVLRRPPAGDDSVDDDEGTPL